MHVVLLRYRQQFIQNINQLYVENLNRYFPRASHKRGGNDLHFHRIISGRKERFVENTQSRGEGGGQ